MKAEIPEVENIVRLSTLPAGVDSRGSPGTPRIEKVVLRRFHVLLRAELPADSWRPARALAPPFSLVMTAGEAMRVFGR